MSLIRIDAKIECDNCGRHFAVDIDPSSKPLPGWSVFEIVEDAIRGSILYRENENLYGFANGSSSVQDGQMLCAKCTSERDAKEES